MSDTCTVKNVTRTRIRVPGVGALAPNETAEVEETDAITELATNGALSLTRLPKPKPRPERAPDPDPTSEEE